MPLLRVNYCIVLPSQYMRCPWQLSPVACGSTARYGGHKKSTKSCEMFLESKRMTKIIFHI